MGVGIGLGSTLGVRVGIDREEGGGVFVMSWGEGGVDFMGMEAG